MTFSHLKTPPPKTEDEIERRRLFDLEYSQRVMRNERQIARIGVLVAVVAGAASVHMLLAVDRGLGIMLLALALGYGLYAGLVVPRVLRHERWLVLVQRINVSVEVSLAFVISLVDVYFVDGRYAITSTPILFVFLAVIASSIRWRPQLALYAGTLGALEQGVLYAVAQSDISAAKLADLPSLSVGHALQRSAYVFIAGLLAAVSARVGRTIAERVVNELLEQDRVRRLFGEYVSEQAVDSVLRGDIALAGERRDVTVLFADIRGFTTLSSELEPETIVDYLNRYFGAVSQVIAAQGGLVNKFMGDGLLAVFGAPEPQADHGRRAVRAAGAMIEAARVVKRPDGQPTSIGVGMHTGELVLGSVGSPHHRDYTVIGDTVNVASRIEGLTKELGECILLTGETRAAAGDSAEYHALGERCVKGRKAPLQLYALRPDEPGDTSR